MYSMQNLRSSIKSIIYKFIQRRKDKLSLSQIAEILFRIDLIPLIIDALGILNLKWYLPFVVLDTVTCLFLVLALFFRKNENGPRPSDILGKTEFAIVFIASIPFPLLFLVIPELNLLGGGVLIVRFARLIPRVLRISRMTFGIIGLSNKPLLVGFFAVIMWVFAIGISVNSSQSSSTNLGYMIQVVYGLLLFALVHEIRQRTFVKLLQLYEKRMAFVVSDLKTRTKKMVADRAFEAGLDDDIRNQLGQLDDFSQSDDLPENSQIEKASRIFSQFSNISGASKTREIWRGLQTDAQLLVRTSLLLRIFDWVLCGLIFFVLLLWITPQLQYALIILLSDVINLAIVEMWWSRFLLWWFDLDSGIRLFGGFLFVLAFYFVIKQAVQLITELTRTGTDDLVGAFVPKPITAILMLELLKSTFPNYVKLFQFSDVDLVALVIWTWVAFGFFNGVVIYILKFRAKKTDTVYDDVMAELLQRLGVVVIVVVSVLIVLAQVNWSSEGIFATVLTTGFGTVLLYMGRDFAENFFAGIYLVAAKPFQVGDRIQLPTGEICDVVEIGQTGTRLYKETENSEIIVPNKAIAQEVIINLSRPDPMLRVETSVFINGLIDNAASVLHWILWNDSDVAKFQPRDSISLAKEIALKHRLLKVECRNIKTLLNKIVKLQNRLNSEKISDKDQSNLLMEISSYIYQSKILVAQMTERRLESARLKIEQLALLLSHHPMVVSSFQITDDGKSYIKLTAMFFVAHAQRSTEILSNIQPRIQKAFRENGINLPDPFQ